MAAALACLVAGAAVALDRLQAPPSLKAVAARMEQAWPGIEHVAPGDLGSRLAEAVLVDAREEAEHKVSRIAGAVRIDPAAPAAEVAERLGARVAGKPVVFYCSVGVRSSQMAGEAADALRRYGARTVINLKGGIFAWSNAGLPLVDERGATRLVHPFDARWGRLVTDRDRISLTPARP